MKTVITYGTFDLFHIGHLNILRRARALGDRLVVGLSTDDFNLRMKNKTTIIPFHDRKIILEAIRYVDLIIPEESWDQKIEDIKKHKADVFVMGHDWEGKFDFLKPYCDVVYLRRTEDISSTQIKQVIAERRNSPVSTI